MEARDFIGKMVAVEIDRPAGSKHPEHELVYEASYGFVPDIMAPDGEFLDAYILGEAEPLSRFEGECILSYTGNTEWSGRRNVDVRSGYWA